MLFFVIINKLGKIDTDFFTLQSGDRINLPIDAYRAT